MIRANKTKLFFTFLLAVFLIVFLGQLKQNIYFAKEPVGLHDILIARSRHTECVVLMTKCGSDKK